MVEAKTFFLFALVFATSAGILAGPVMGMGKQAQVVRLNLLIYYFIGLPLGIVLTFSAGMRASGIWIGQFVAAFLVNLRYVILVLKSDYKSIIVQIRERDKVAP